MEGKLGLVTPAAHHSGVVTQFNSKETISSQRPGRWVVALNSPSLSRSNFFFAIFCVCVFCIFLIASPLVALLEDHSLGLAGNASNLYFVFRNPPTTWELTPRHRSSPLQIPETTIQRDFAAQFPPPPSPFYVTCLFLTF